MSKNEGLELIFDRLFSTEDDVIVQREEEDSFEAALKKRKAEMEMEDTYLEDEDMEDMELFSFGFESENPLKLQGNIWMGDMHLMDGDIFVIKTRFNKDIYPVHDNYNENLENAFVYVHGVYEETEILLPDILKELRVDVLVNKYGQLKSYGCKTYKKGVCWKDIEKDILHIFIWNTISIRQFNTREATTMEYIGNCGLYKFGEDKHLRLINKWLLNKDNIPVMSAYEYCNRLLGIPDLFIGDVYKHKSRKIRLEIEEWREDEDKDIQLYRALKNAGIRERDTDLILSLGEKMRLNVVKIKCEHNGAKDYLTKENNTDELPQPILIGFNLTNLCDLVEGDNEVAYDLKQMFGYIDTFAMKKIKPRKKKE